MQRPFVLALGLGAVATVLLVISGTVYMERPTHLKVAVSSSDADDYDLVGAAAKLLKRGHHSIRLTVVNADGAAAASAALEAGTADLAVVRPDVAMPPNGDTVVLLHKDAALLIAPAGGTVAKIDDLEGKRIGVLSPRIGDERLLDAALAQYDVDAASVTRVPLKLEDIAGAIEGKSVDAVFAVGLVSAGLLPATVKAVAAAGHGAPVFLPVAEAAAVAERNPAYQSLEVLRGAFGGTPPKPADEFDTLSVTYQLVANAELNPGLVGSLTRFLLSERVALAQIAPVARRMEAPSTDKGSAIPVHPGTAAYIDDEEESFLDRYSDLIYIGAMVLGVLASGMTAIVSRFGGQGGVRVEDLVARLLQIFKSIRVAPTTGVLDQMEDEVDGIVASALDDGCLRSLDERRVAMLNMAVEQVRAVIRDRREALRRAQLRPANDEPLLAFEGPATLAFKPFEDRQVADGRLP